MKKFILLFLFAASHHSSYSYTICRAIASGNWGNAGTWSCGRAPANNDSLIIPAGITVFVDVNYDYSGGAAMEIDLLGTLSFNNGKKLHLPCGSEIWIENAGLITVTGGGSSNNIDICGTAVWSSDQGDATGPMYLSNTSAMPIELKTFYALPQSKKVMLHWETATETDNKDFTVERSKDGISYSVLSVLPSKAPHGNSLKSVQYEYLDEKPIEGTSYYRFKQTDYNGKFKYFQSISVDMEKSNNVTFTVYPNPNQGQFTVDFTGVENNHEIEVVMYDQQGKLVYQKTIMSESLATNTFSIIPDEKIASGTYMVNFVVESVKHPVKVMVQ